MSIIVRKSKELCSTWMKNSGGNAPEAQGSWLGTILMNNAYYAQDSGDRTCFQRISNITTITPQLGWGGRYWGFSGLSAAG